MHWDALAGGCVLMAISLAVACLFRSKKRKISTPGNAQPTAPEEVSTASLEVTPNQSGLLEKFPKPRSSSVESYQTYHPPGLSRESVANNVAKSQTTPVLEVDPSVQGGRAQNASKGLATSAIPDQSSQTKQTQNSGRPAAGTAKRKNSSENSLEESTESSEEVKQIATQLATVGEEVTEPQMKPSRSPKTPTKTTSRPCTPVMKKVSVDQYKTARPPSLAKLQHHVDTAKLERSRTDLLTAYEEHDLQKLMQAIRTAEEEGLEVLLHKEIRMASTRKAVLLSIKKTTDDVVAITQDVIIEVAKYRVPPAAVHEILRAALLVTGDCEEITKDWMVCKKRCSTVYSKDYHGLFHRMSTFNLRYLHPEIAARALQIIRQYSVDEVANMSRGVAVFYTWTRLICEECLSNLNHEPEAATGSRQIELLMHVNKQRQFDITNPELLNSQIVYNTKS